MNTATAARRVIDGQPEDTFLTANAPHSYSSMSFFKSRSRSRLLVSRKLVLAYFHVRMA